MKHEVMAKLANELSVDFNKPLPQESLRSITERIDSTDLVTQTDLYNKLVGLECNDAVSQLRHRAAMLRAKADEMDREADDMVNQSLSLVKLSDDVALLYVKIKDIIAAHAHIKPTKVG